MSFDIRAEFGETKEELGEKVDRKLNEGYELWGEVEEKTFEMEGMPTLHRYYQFLFKEI
jgi:hypothetical protein